MSRDALDSILACPRCRSMLTRERDELRCPRCDGRAKVEGRIIDIRALTPELPLHFAQYSRALHEAAGEHMPDFETDWRVESVLNLVASACQGAVCLEIGGADGPMTGRLESLFGTTMTIDFGMSFLRRVEAKTKDTICLCGDAQFLPFVSGSVDVVVCSEVLEHVSVPTQLLLEIRRVLRRTGKCVLSVPRQTRCDLFGLEMTSSDFPRPILT
jgi:2-polyprenyl-3-methyl-5-hydroxy-6-metoxy-1,4-benzoquinol methylase